MKNLHIAFLLALLIVPDICRATYDPTVGRWISRDPLGEQVGPNLYQYVYNDPILFNDPFGLNAHITINGHSTVAGTGQALLDQLHAAADGSVTDLNIVGHAGDSQQGIGESSNRDVLDDLNGTIKLGLNNGKGAISQEVDILDLLRRKLSPKGTVELNGCHTASGGDNNITTDLAKALPGHAVTGNRYSVAILPGDNTIVYPFAEYYDFIFGVPGSKYSPSK